MSYKFVVEDKLHWTFRLYDQDGSGEIDPDEMELIFTKFCKICESTEVKDTNKNFLAPTGAQGVEMCVCVLCCTTYKLSHRALRSSSLFVRSSHRVSQIYLLSLPYSY